MIHIGMGSLIGMTVAAGLLGILAFRAVRSSLNPGNGKNPKEEQGKDSIQRM